MSDRGFYHPERGYWQTNSDVPEDILAGYPDGTVEVSLMPEAGAIWDGDQWLPAPPPSLEETFEAIRLRRDQAIAAGTTVAGIPVQTDETSQTRIMGAAVAAMLDPGYTVQWKTATGDFVTLTAAQVIGIASAVRAHVQACFDREAELRTAVLAEEPFEIGAGWPEGGA